jgi:hypothetical protein
MQSFIPTMATSRLSCVALTVTVSVAVFVVYSLVSNFDLNTVASERLILNHSSTPLSSLKSVIPDCGKICSYDFDSKEDGRLYPLLRKNVSCQNIMQRMISPPYKVVKPPPRKPPPEMINNYTQNGQCQMNYYHRYIDESGKSESRVYSAEQFNNLLMRETKSNINAYGEGSVQPTLNKYVDQIRDKHILVVGTQIPWAEAMLINRGARKVTTAEYNNISILHPKCETIKQYKLAEKFFRGQVELFDAAFSYSSLEHTGIGRYGDPLMPHGDLEATAQIWCMVKPGGYFFMAVPVSGNRKGCWYAWNAHRIYGEVRLQHLTANWEVLEEHGLGAGHNVLYVLKKS